MSSPFTSPARRATRHAALLACEIVPENGASPLFGTITDLSLTGARVTAESVPDAGTEVLLCFRPPGWQEDVILAAAVVHLGTDGALFGLAFAAIDHDLAMILAESLTHLPPRLPRLEDEVVEIIDLDEAAASGVMSVCVEAIVVGVDTLSTEPALDESDGDDVFVSLRDSEIEIIRIAS